MAYGRCGLILLAFAILVPLLSASSCFGGPEWTPEQAIMGRLGQGTWSGQDDLLGSPLSFTRSGEYTFGRHEAVTSRGTYAVRVLEGDAFEITYTRTQGAAPPADRGYFEANGLMTLQRQTPGSPKREYVRVGW